MADLKAIAERWAPAINDYVSVKDIATVEKARELLDSAIEDIDAMMKAVEKERERVEALKVLVSAGHERHAFHLHTLGIEADLDGGVEAVDLRVQELAAFGQLGIAVAVAEADEANDAAFDEALDRLFAGARELAGLPPRDGVSPRKTAVGDTEPAPPEVTRG